MNIPFPLFPIVSGARYFTSSMNRIDKILLALCHSTSNSEQWLFIFIRQGSRQAATTTITSKYVVITRVSQLLSDITSSRKPLVKDRLVLSIRYVRIQSGLKALTAQNRVSRYNQVQVVKQMVLPKIYHENQLEVSQWMCTSQNLFKSPIYPFLTDAIPINLLITFRNDQLQELYLLSHLSGVNSGLNFSLSIYIIFSQIPTLHQNQYLHVVYFSSQEKQRLNLYFNENFTIKTIWVHNLQKDYGDLLGTLMQLATNQIVGTGCFIECWDSQELLYSKQGTFTRPPKIRPPNNGQGRNYSRSLFIQEQNLHCIQQHLIRSVHWTPSWQRK